MLALGMLAAAPAGAQTASCDMSQYRAGAGLTAEANAQSLMVVWNGDPGVQLRMQFGIYGGVPTIDDLSLRRGEGAWTQVADKVTPEFSVATGTRRISMQQLQPMRDLKMPLDMANVSKYRWEPFWDAPLDLSATLAPGTFTNTVAPPEGIEAAGQPGTPRKASEVERATAVYHVTSCKVVSDGGRLTVEFPGVDLGVFSGTLRFTAFRGTNMIRQELVAKTAKEWVAYKYDAGLKGLTIKDTSRVHWRDTSNIGQDYRLRGGVNASQVPLRAANRIVAVEQGGGAIAAFPPPHKFFFSRELSVNMGYNWYRKDNGNSYSFGIRQSEHEDFGHPHFLANWALYSARPGTEQLMTVFLFPALGKAEDAVDRALAFTNGDRYRPLPGYQVMNHHYHMDVGARLQREGSADVKLQDMVALKAMGLNIISPVDSIQLTAFTEAGDRMEQKDPAAAAKRKEEQNQKSLGLMAMSRAAAKVHSDDSFLIMPSQELFRGPLGGHTDLLFSRPVYWDERLPGQPAEESHPQYGKIYHIGGAGDLMQMVRKENILISMPHPRSKGSTGFPDAVKDRTYFSDPHYLGFGARWGMGLDGSEKRLCEYRCWPLLDDMSNWMVDKNVPLKKIVSISEVMDQAPGDDIYGSSPVTYLRLGKLPGPEDVSPVIDALMNNYSFWTTGEVLVPAFEVQGAGRQAKIVADLQWTFPLDFVEVVWGDGKTTGRQIVSATDYAAFGQHRFEIPFDARGKKWVRFAAWDIASNGAVLQPVRLPR